MEGKRSIQDLWAAARPGRGIFRKAPSDSDHADLRRVGDRARDAQRWSEATTCYSKYLEQIPGDTAIWVQFGNCSKEAGQYKQALEAYDAALALDDATADTHLQKGHLLKTMGRRDDAIASYLRSYELQPNGNPAFDELLRLDAGTLIGAAMREGDDLGVQAQERIRRAATSGDGATIYLDVTDLIDYLRVNISLSGIQRVVSNLIVCSEEFMKSSNGSRVRPVLPDFNGSLVYAVRLSLIEQLVAMVREGRTERPMLDRAIEAVLSTKSLVELNPGDTLLIAGAFWIYGRYDLLNQLRQHGVRVTVFIHDLLQITNPEYVEAAVTRAFRRSFVDVLYVSSYILTNSKFVAGEVERYLKQRMNFSIPTIPVTLGTELGMRNVRLTSVNPEYLELATEEYVLCVATIEIRKNHIYVVKIWERLIEEFGGHVPNLVFVGKWGWEIDQLQKYLASSDYLGGRLYIYNEIPDNDLAFLYQHCLFTIYPSFAEGWGLPVGESLGYGKPSVASKVTAIPEIGGPLCKYFDPLDLEDGYAVVSATLSDRPGLAAWAARIEKQFEPKTWNDFCSELFGVVQRYGRDKTIDHSRNNSIVEIGEIAPFGSAALPLLEEKSQKMVTARMTRMSGWHGLEAWGCWAAKRRATLKVNTRLAPDTDVMVYLHLRTPDWAEVADCTIKVNGTSTFVDGLGPVPRWHTATGTVSDGGVVDITLVSGKGFFQSASDGERYIGILDLAVAPVDDAAARLQLLDQIVPGGVPRADASSGMTLAGAPIATS